MVAMNFGIEWIEVYETKTRRLNFEELEGV